MVTSVTEIKSKPTIKKPDKIEPDQESPISTVGGEPDIEQQLPKPLSTTRKTTVWSPITKAIHSIASLATLVVAADVRAETKKLSPRAGAFEFVKPSKGSTKISTQELDDIVVTAEVKRKDTIIELRAPDRKLKTKDRVSRKGDMESRIPTEKKEVRPKKGSEERRRVPIETTPAVEPSSKALSMLGLLATSSTVDDSNLVKAPKPDKRIDLASGQDRIESFIPGPMKRITTAHAKIADSSGLAISELDKVARESREALYLDEITPIEARVPRMSMREEPTDFITKKRMVESITKGRSVGVADKSAQIVQGIKRELKIDKGTSSAVGLLNKIALTTAIARAETIAEVYSRPITDLEETGIVYSAPQRLPLTKSVTLIPSRPDIEPERERSISLEESFKHPERAIYTGDITYEDRRSFYRSKDLLAAKKMKPTIGGPKEPDVKAIDLLSLIAKSTVQPRVTDESVSGTEPGKPRTIPEIKDGDRAGLIRSRGVAPPASGKGKIIPQTPIPVVTVRNAQRIKSLSEAFGLIRGRYERRLMARVGLGEDIPGKRPGQEQVAMPGVELVRRDQISGPGVSDTYSAERELKGVQTSSLSRAQRLDLQAKLASQTSQRSAEKAPKLYPTKPPKSEDYDWLPRGAPKKRDENREQIMVLEEKVRILRERLSEMAPGREPPTKKLQEFVHDPNLQNQLKKLFYESWLENMDKELKRYGG
jgi:hypothetical protein